MSRYLAKAIRDLVFRMISVQAPSCFLGVWVAAESTDANLSQVRSAGQIYRYVPKLASASALAVGDRVWLMQAPGCPLTIIGEHIGDITQVP